MGLISFLDGWASRFFKADILCRKVWLLPLGGDGRGVNVSGVNVLRVEIEKSVFGFWQGKIETISLPRRRACKG